MPKKTEWIDLYGVSEYQTEIMNFIDWWVRNKKTLIPQKEVVKKMSENGHKKFTTVKALRALLRKGYIRRGDPRGTGMPNNQTYYVQLRRVH